MSSPTTDEVVCLPCVVRVSNLNPRASSQLMLQMSVPSVCWNKFNTLYNAQLQFLSGLYRSSKPFKLLWLHLCSCWMNISACSGLCTTDNCNQMIDICLVHAHWSTSLSYELISLFDLHIAIKRQNTSLAPCICSDI